MIIHGACPGLLRRGCAAHIVGIHVICGIDTDGERHPAVWPGAQAMAGFEVLGLTDGSEKGYECPVCRAFLDEPVSFCQKVGEAVWPAGTPSSELGES